MTLSVTFRPEVAPEVDAIYQWYEGEKTGLGQEFLDALRQAYDRIAEFPDGPALLYRDVRVRKTLRFPCGSKTEFCPIELS